jgi:hypothetical protein
MTRPRLFLLTASAAIAVALTSPVQAQGLYPQWEISLQRLLSGLKVSGSQSSATALQTTNAHKAAAEAAASTLVSQDNALRLARAQHRYGYDTGTGYAACDVALMTSEESDSYASEVKVRQAFRAQPGGFGAGDSDASAWLLNRDYGAEEVMTAADYIDVVAPLPTVKPNPSTAEQDAAFVIARRQGAIMSGARAGLVGVLVGGMGGESRQGGSP